MYRLLRQRRGYDLWQGQGMDRLIADEITGLFTGYNKTGVQQMMESFKHRTDADAILPVDLPERRQLFAGPVNAFGDHAGYFIRQLHIDRLLHMLIKSVIVKYTKSVSVTVDQK